MNPSANKNPTDGKGGAGGISQQKQQQPVTTTAATTTNAIKSTLHANKTILKTVSVFLASGKRNSNNQSRNLEIALKNKRRLRQQKMDELSGKLNPKLLESLRKKTRFSK